MVVVYHVYGSSARIGADRNALSSPIEFSSPGIAVITVAPAVKYSFVSKGMQTRRTGQHKAKLTLSPRLHVKPLITVITVIKIGV